MAELKEELSKLGIAPGRKRKAELIKALQEALDESQSSPSSRACSNEDTASPDSDPGDDSSNGAQRTDQLLQQTSHAKGNLRRISFVDIESLDEEQQVEPHQFLHLQAFVPFAACLHRWLMRLHCFHWHP